MLNLIVGGTLKAYRNSPERNVYFLVAALHRLLKIIYEVHLLGIFHFDIKGVKYLNKYYVYILYTISFTYQSLKRLLNCKDYIEFVGWLLFFETSPFMNCDRNIAILRSLYTHIYYISEENIAFTHSDNPDSATLLDWGSAKYANQVNQKYYSKIVI